jgi:O-antigen ligase
MTSLAYLFLWGFVFVTPWEQVVHINGIGTISKLVGIATLAVTGLTVLRSGRLRPPTLFHFWAVCFVLWGGITVCWTLDQEGTLFRFVRNLQLLSLLWLIWEVAWSRERQRGLLQAYVLGAAVSAINIILNYVAGRHLHDRARFERFVATGFEPNDIAFLLVLSLPMAWHLGTTHRLARVRWLNRVYLLVAMLAIALTASRGGLILSVVALMIVPWTMARLQFRMKVAMLVVLAASGIIALRYISPRSLARLETTKTEITQGTLNEREVIWRAGLHLVPSHPLGGIGAGAFEKAVVPFLGYPKTAHNSYLAVLIEQGVIGLTLFLLMFLSAFIHVRSAPPEDRRFFFILLVTLFIGLLPRTWEDEKQTWLVLSLLLAPAAAASATEPVPPPRATRWESAARLPVSV